MPHGRNLIRHLLAAVLMLGTLAGTVWTFSNGQLTLSGGWERITSVGGISAALEIGAIFTGLYIGELTIRIKSARRRDVAETYARQRTELYRWFYGVVAISCGANLIFRAQQLGNFPLALFVSLAPAPLIVLFTVKLQPLPVDYAEQGRQATQKALVNVTMQAGKTLERYIERMGQGKTLTPAEVQLLGFATAMTAIHAERSEQHALDYAITQGAGAPAGRVVEGGMVEYLTTAVIVQRYGVSKRTAQLWIGQIPGRRKVAKGNGWEAPASEVYAQHPLPALSTSPLLAAPRANLRTHTSAPPRTEPAVSAPADASGPPTGAADAQAFVSSVVL